MAEKEIIRIPVTKLIAHEQNPNRMRKDVFAKLVGHIERTGNYEPIVVRRHPKQPGCYQMLNGHHRKLALEQLGYTHADCVVWQVDDEEALILLATLNRLGGVDDVSKKQDLFERLSKRYASSELADMLNETRANIEKLRDLTSRSLPQEVPAAALLHPVVFYLNDDQLEVVTRVIEREAESCEGTKAQRRSDALVRICQNHMAEEDVNE